MHRTVLILGATGGFGRAAVRQMAEAGWQVRALARKGKPAEGLDGVADFPSDIEWITGSLDDRELLLEAACGVDAIVHAVNVPYPKWDALMPGYTSTIIDLALENQSHIFFVGNIYNAGIPQSGVIDEVTADNPVNDKGVLRARLEKMLQDGCQSGLRCTVMRFGDFFGPDIPTPNWFNESVKSLHKNKLTVPGSMDASHAWAYLPDAARALEQVASVRIRNTEQPAYMEVPFAGHQFSFRELKQQLEQMGGRTLKVVGMPWPLLKIFGLVIPVFRDLASMRYLWDHSIRLDNTALTRLLGRAPDQTPLDAAICAIVPEFRQ